jgi:hypothetical protein
VKLFLLPLVLPGILLATDPLIEQHFDDPQQLVPKEGAVDVSHLRTGDIASGHGARTRPMIKRGREPETEGPKNPPICFVEDPGFGSRRVFRSRIEPGGGTGSAGLVVMPEDSDGGLTRLTTFGDGISTLSGGFDFFFRLSAEKTDVASGFSLWIWSGLLGVNLTPSRDGKSLLLGTFVPEKVLSVSDKAGKEPEKVSRIMGKRLSELKLGGGTIYHAAVLFTTSGEEVSISLFIQEGTGPIDVTNQKSLHAKIEGLRIASDQRLEDDGDKFAFELTRADFPQTLDLACFRLYATPPDIFPGLIP